MRGLVLGKNLQNFQCGIRKIFSSIPSEFPGIELSTELGSENEGFDFRENL